MPISGGRQTGLSFSAGALKVYQALEMAALDNNDNKESLMPRISVCLALAAIAMAAPSLSCAEDGQALAQKNACLSCHSVDKKVYGPALRDVSKSYAADKAGAEKIAAFMRTGGSGKWGSAAMPGMAHVPEGEAKAIAEWIAGLERPAEKPKAEEAKPKTETKPAPSKTLKASGGASQKAK